MQRFPFLLLLLLATLYLSIAAYYYFFLVNSQPELCNIISHSMYEAIGQSCGPGTVTCVKARINFYGEKMIDVCCISGIQDLRCSRVWGTDFYHPRELSTSKNRCMIAIAINGVFATVSGLAYGVSFWF